MPSIKIDQIIVKNKNPRTALDNSKLQELADSIRERGILQPLVCRTVNGQYELVAGHRRLEAAKLVGLIEVPVMIRETDDDDIQFDQIIENLQREDLSAEDKFQAFKKMRDQGLKISEISKKIGVNSTAISTILSLEDLDPEIRKRNDIEEYPKQLISKTPNYIQSILAERIAKGELVVRCLLADILPTINKVKVEKLFTEEEKKHTILRIANETIFHDYPARSIFNQESGKKKMEQAGITPKVISNNTMEDYINRCKSFSSTLFDIQSTHLQYLDQGLVLRLFSQLKDIKSHIESLIPNSGGKNGEKKS